MRKNESSSEERITSFMSKCEGMRRVKESVIEKMYQEEEMHVETESETFMLAKKTVMPRNKTN